MIAVQIDFYPFGFQPETQPIGLLPTLLVIGLMLVALYGIGMFMASFTLISSRAGW
jgi:hypothetical protein